MRARKQKDENQTMINSPPAVSINSLNGVITPRHLGQLCYSLGDIEGNTMEIIALLLQGEHTVTEISKHIGKSDSATSQRLSKLRLQGFVSQRSKDTTRIYSIDPEVKTKIVNAVNQVFGS